MDASARARGMTATALRNGCTVACWVLRCRPILDSVLDGCISSPAPLYSIVTAAYVLLRRILDVSLYDADPVLSVTFWTRFEAVCYVT